MWLTLTIPIAWPEYGTLIRAISSAPLFHLQCSRRVLGYRKGGGFPVFARDSSPPCSCFDSGRASEPKGEFRYACCIEQLLLLLMSKPQSYLFPPQKEMTLDWTYFSVKIVTFSNKNQGIPFKFCDCRSTDVCHWTALFTGLPGGRNIVLRADVTSVFRYWNPMCLDRKSVPVLMEPPM